MKQLKWWLFAVLALVLAWRIVAVNIAQQLVSNGNVTALQWQHNNPYALLAKASDFAPSEKVEAAKLTLASAWFNPADGRTFVRLALLFQQQGQLLLAVKAADMANFLAPRDVDVQLTLGTFWASQGEPVAALVHWAAALDARPALAESLFPMVLEIASLPQLHDSITPVLSQPSLWRGSFFKYALKNTVDEHALKAIYQMQAGHMEQDTRQAYFDYLLKKGRYTDAYFIWLNELHGADLAALGNVYDGGFEQEVKDEGFGWRRVPDSAYKIAPEPTYGHSGQRAMHVALQEAPVSPRILYQYLMLDSGRYELRGRVRLDNLNAGKGMQWLLGCGLSENKATLLAQSTLFTGTDVWQQFAIPVEVPMQECAIQELRLVLNKAEEYDAASYSGAIWLDDVVVVKIN